MQRCIQGLAILLFCLPPMSSLWHLISCLRKLGQVRLLFPTPLLAELFFVGRWPLEAIYCFFFLHLHC